MSNQAEVTVYTTPTCGFCHMVKKYLDDKKIEYKTLDITEDQDSFNRVMELTGQPAVPVTTIGDKFVIGFDRNKIDLLLREEGMI